MIINRKSLSIVTIILVLLTIPNIFNSQDYVFANSEPQKIIQTFGEAEITSSPDLAKISLVIETRSKLAEDAVDENARIANTVWEALLNYGISEENLKTGSYRLNGYRESVGNRPENDENLVYYRATNEIMVSTTRLDDIGEIIDLAVIAGANNINYINFELKDPQKLMMKALKIAIQQAERKAETIAQGAGVNIKQLYSVREEKTNYIPFRLQDSLLQREMLASNSPTPIKPDEVTVKAVVIAKYIFE